MSVVANVVVNVDAKGAAQELNKIDTAARGLTGSVGALQTAVAALGLGLAIKSIAGVGNESEASKIKLQALTAQYNELNQAESSVDRIQKLLGISAIEARDSYAQLYGSLRGTGLSAQQLEVLFVGLTKAAKLSGGGAQEAQTGIMQLKQAFSSGALSGDELRSVLENMPAFAQAVGRETDKLGLTSKATSADLKNLGAEGKLTSNILFEAAKNLANAQAPGLTAAEKLNNAFKNLQEKIAEAFGPSVTALIERFSATITVVGNWFTNNKESISAVAKAFLNLAISVGPLAIGILAVVKAYEAWRNISKAVATIQSYLLGLTGPKGLALVAGAAIAAGVAYTALNGILAGTDEELKKQQLEAKKAGNELKNITNNVAPLPSKVQETADKTKFLADGFRQTALEVTKGQIAIEAQIASLDRGATITAARYEAEKALNDLKVQELEREYQFATTAEQRLDIISEILAKELEGAKLEYQQKLENIELEKQKLNLKIKQAELEYKSLEVAGKRQILEAKNAEEEQKKKEQMNQALSKQNEVISATKQLGTANQEISKYQKLTAEAQFKSKELSIQQKFEQSAVKNEVGLTKEKASQLSNNIINNIKNTNQLQSSWVNVRLEIEAAARAAAFARQQAVNSGGGSSNSGNTKKAAKGAYWQGGFEAFRKGGMVNRPTLGLIGEGGEPEYIIPESKMAGASANYLAGARGGAVIPAFANGGVVGGSSRNRATPQISIQTGPVTQMNGTNYVTTKQLAIAVQAGVSQTLAMISGDINTRASLGLA